MRNPLPAACLLILLLAAARAEENWPQFRGPAGDGASDAVGLPTTWSETENVRWKTPIHGRGWSSPVIWEKQIWLTTATEDGRELSALCIDRDSGKIVHDVKVFDVAEPGKIHPTNSYASPTPVVEPGRVYVHFGTYGTACLDTATGRKLWERRDFPCDHMNGPGSSPMVWENLLVFAVDGTDVQYVVALDKQTGQTAWKTPRSIDYSSFAKDRRKAYSTPSVAVAGDRLELILPGAQAVMGYDPATGRELWKLRYSGYSNVVRPVLWRDLALIGTGADNCELWAVRTGGQGDVTDSHLVWTYNKGLLLKTSPVVVDDLVYFVHDQGVAACVEAATGKVVWRKRLGGEYSASPLAADGKVYFLEQFGKSFVIRPGRKYEELAKNILDHGCMASPAVAGRALFPRTEKHLYRIETP
ncbi:MAG: PQQ-like beta-propeller repeat protein [Pirellulales bacterium]|nr:PQQ-like beta-propeller repeat protein [Pirellulales bacterium]